MLKKLAWGLCFSWCAIAAAQVPEYEYFPADRCQTEGVKIVTVYETKIDNPTAQSGPGNRIRLSRNMVRQSYYGQDGLSYRSVRYQNEGKTMVGEVLRTHGADKLLLSDIQRQYNTNFADSTKLLQSNRRRLSYTNGGRLLSTVSTLVSGEKDVLLDSVAYRHSATGQLQTESVFTLQGPTTCILQKEYAYQGSKITVVSKVANQILNRDEFELDGNGRVIRESNFAPGDLSPRLVTDYVYDPRGWLEELHSSPNWEHFSKDQTVVSRKNKYDDHGKLVETQLDYGDGKRLFEFYDYTYWVED